MKLLTPHIIQALPPLQSTQHIPLGSKIIICKFYVPSGRTWYVFEGEVDTQKIYKFFGIMVCQNETFMGYFYLADLIELSEEGDSIQLDDSLFKIRCVDVLRGQPVWSLCKRFCNEKIIRAIPPLYSTEYIPLKDKKIICKFYVKNWWSWYVFEGEFNHEIGYLFFGMVEGYEKEEGYFAFSDLLRIVKAGHPVLINYSSAFNTRYSDVCDADKKSI